MTFLKVLFFLLITWSTAFGMFDHLSREKYQTASYQITKVLDSREGTPELREACRQLIVSESLILKSTKRAEKAKRICEEVFGL